MKQILPNLFLLLLISFTSLNAQTTLISGIINDQNGDPLPGAVIYEKSNPSHGTAANFEGQFQIEVKENSELVVRLMGFQEQVVIATQNIKVIMKEDAMELEAIEVVGSRSQNRTVTETPVAIDVINLEEVTAATGQLDMNQLLRITSYNVCYTKLLR